MSNPQHSAQADFTPCGAAQSFEALTARVGLTAPACAATAEGCTETQKIEHQEARFALGAAVAGVAMWTFLVYELASKLQVPT